MSSTYTKNDKELSGVRVVSSTEVWIYNEKTKKNDKLNPNLALVGKIDMTMPNVVLKANRKDGVTGFVEDTSALTKRTKKDIVDHFYDKNGRRNKNRVAYLIRTDKGAKVAKNKKK